MRIVDAHVHVWDADAAPIPWFRDDLGLPRQAAAARLGRELTDAGVSSAIAVQAADSVAEAEWLTATAARDPFLRRVVLQYTPAPGRAAGATAVAFSPAVVGVRAAVPQYAADLSDVHGLDALADHLGGLRALDHGQRRPPSPDGTPTPRSSSATSASAPGRPMPHGSPRSPRLRRLRGCRRRSPGSTSRRAGRTSRGDCCAPPSPSSARIG